MYKDEFVKEVYSDNEWLDLNNIFIYVDMCHMYYNNDSIGCTAVKTWKPQPINYSLENSDMT